MEALRQEAAKTLLKAAGDGTLEAVLSKKSSKEGWEVAKVNENLSDTYTRRHRRMDGWTDGHMDRRMDYVWKQAQVVPIGPFLCDWLKVAARAD